jgi:hypothetical protein
LALLQPGVQYTDEAYGGALLVAAFMRDVHLIRTSAVDFKGSGDPVDDG